MSCTFMPLPGPSISCLDVLVNWDLSGAAANVTLTNNSAVSNAANLKWWFYVVSPSGVAIYGTDLNGLSVLPTPDVAGTAWTTKTIVLPTPFTNGACGQIEFSPTNPYSVYVFVQDTASSPFVSFWQLLKTAIIVRPRGNSQKICGNFGVAQVSMQTDCLGKSINVYDSTNLEYNNILVPASTSNSWELVYPQDNAGNIPNRTATNTPNVTFPISVNSKGYVLYLREFATYDYGNGVTVKIQYKAYDEGGSLGLQFAINCNTNLCLLQCQMQKFYKLSKGSCGTLEYPGLLNKMTQMSFLFSQVLTGIFQPLCGIDVPGLIEEIQAIGGFDNNCDCNCGGDNFGFSNPTGGGNGGSGCCPLYASVIDINTDIAPANCPNGYFPAYIYDPTGTTVIGVALSMSDEINILNGNADWRAYGTAFSAGNCTVGWYPATGVTIIPNILIDPIGGGNGQGSVIVDVLSFCASPVGAPAACPGSYFPAQVYNAAASAIIGVASDINNMVSILNGNATWQAYGTAYVVDNCHVGFYPLPTVGTIPPVYVNDSSCIRTACVNGSQRYPIGVTDICYPSGTPITAYSFPLNLYVDFALGAGSEFAGNVANQTEMIAALNAMADKPASVTFYAGATVDQVIVVNTDCNAYSATISTTADAGSNKFLLYAGDHFDMTGSTPQDSVVSEYAASVQYLSVLGKLPGAIKGTLWHSIKIGNVLAITNTNNPGAVVFYDITNPLMPTYLKSIALNPIIGISNNFTGVPESINIATATSPATAVPTIYDLYFPTDYYAPMDLSALYVVESNTGSIWKLNFYDTGTGIVASFQDDRLIGKCPRVIQNNKIYFTQDGDLEQATSQTSGVAEGDIVMLDLASFNSSGLSTTTILLNNLEYVWAASFDGADTIYFTGQAGSVVKYTVSTDTVDSRYLNFLGLGILFGYRLNTTYFNGYLYMVPQQMPLYIGMIIQVTAFGGSGTVTHFADPGFTVEGAFNFTPLGNCLGILTSATVPGSSIARMLIYKLGGEYMAAFPPGDNREFYNVVPIGNISTVTPNNFV